MTDPVIDVIYRLAAHARNAGQKTIPVAIFPCRLDNANWQNLNRTYANRKDLLQFWASLAPAYSYFERTHDWPRPHVDQGGRYIWPELGTIG
jgi:murein L,D-transpeptidase YafK